MTTFEIVLIIYILLNWFLMTMFAILPNYKEMIMYIKQQEKQEKLLGLYQTRERLTETKSYHEFNENNIKWQELTKQIKELENES